MQNNNIDKFVVKFFFFTASISPLGSPFSLIIFGILSDKIGRRKALQISFVPIITSWLVLALANSYRTILIGRVLLGFTCGKQSHKRN